MVEKREKLQGWINGGDGENNVSKGEEAVNTGLGKYTQGKI